MSTNLNELNKLNIAKLEKAKTKFSIAYVLDHILSNTMYVKSIDFITKKEFILRKKEVLEELNNAISA